MTNPRICPVSGMFLDEPVGLIYYAQTTYPPYSPVWQSENGYGYETNPEDELNFEQGNCFATREDAERYAKHLKAMAKLRRLEGVINNYDADPSAASQTLYYGTKSQLTPEEQNALLWPNEEK